MMVARRSFLFTLLLLGPLVPASYVWSARRWADHVGGLWGEIPASWQTPYTANMPLAAIGYLLFTWYFYRHGNAGADARGGMRWSGLTAAYVAILIPSLLWMPLTLHALALSDAGYAPVIQGVLLLVAAGTSVVGWSLFHAQSDTKALRLARIGFVPFALQTVVLDALVWPRFFHVG